MSDERKFELDPAGVNDSVCYCCGAPCKSLTGFVNEGNGTRAGYIINLIEGDPNHDMLVALGIGRWGEDSSQDTRVLVCCSIQLEMNGSRRYKYLDPKDTAWSNDDFLGVPVPLDYINEEIETESKLLLDFILDSEKRFSEFQLN